MAVLTAAAGGADSAARPGLPGRAVSQSQAAASSSCFEVALQRNTFPVAIFSFSRLITISVKRRARPAQPQSAHDLTLDSCHGSRCNAYKLFIVLPFVFNISILFQAICA